MSDPDLQDKLAQPIRVLQIIVLAMVLGVVGFVGSAVAVRAAAQALGQPEGTGPLITYVAIAFAAGCVLVRGIVAGIVVQVMQRKMAQETSRSDRSVGPSTRPRDGSAGGDGEATQLFNIFRTKTIIVAAVLEGAALFVVVAYMLEGKPLALLGAIVLAVLLACHFPTRAAAVGWIEDQRRLLEQERMLSR